MLSLSSFVLKALECRGQILFRSISVFFLFCFFVMSEKLFIKLQNLLNRNTLDPEFEKINSLYTALGKTVVLDGSR